MKAWKITSDGISMQETSSQSVRDGQLKIKTKYTLIGVLDKYLYDTRSAWSARSEETENRSPGETSLP